MMNERRSLLVTGAAGAACALVFILTGLVFRLAFGIATLAELFGDRVAPLLGIPLFFKMLSWFGGYSHLKQIGYLGIVFGEAVVIVIAAVLIARYGRRSLARLRTLTTAAAFAGCIVCIALLWPNLGTNYRGLIPSQAVETNILALVIECALAAWFLAWSLGTWAAQGEESGAEPSAIQGRRRLLVEAGSLLAGVAIVGILVRFFKIAAYAYDGTENAGEDLPPITPNDDFYSVTKNNVDPRPATSVWGLRVEGKVTQPKTLRLSEIVAMPSVLQEVTLQCISNRVGGGLNSNAVWKGVRLKDVLAIVGASPSATQVTFHGADGFTDDVPFAKAMDPATLLVYGMNGVALPLHHGFPARLIVPGYVGEKSVKWVTKIEVLDHEEKGFYEQQGWGPKFTINNTSRFDAPDFSKPIALGSIVRLKGTAFAGDRGVSRVQVSTDGEKTWKEAEISYRTVDTAWVQWRLLWRADTPGYAMLAVRCFDGKGAAQSGQMKGPAPEPATGYQRVKATVKA